MHILICYLKHIDANPFLLGSIFCPHPFYLCIYLGKFRWFNCHFGYQSVPIKLKRVFTKAFNSALCRGLLTEVPASTLYTQVSTGFAHLNLACWTSCPFWQALSSLVRLNRGHKVMAGGSPLAGTKSLCLTFTLCMLPHQSMKKETGNWCQRKNQEMQNRKVHESNPHILPLLLHTTPTQKTANNPEPAVQEFVGLSALSLYPVILHCGNTRQWKDNMYSTKWRP